MPGQELVDPVDFMLGNAAKDISEPRLGIDLVELRRLDERIGCRCSLAASVRPGEKPILPSDGDTPHTWFCRIVIGHAVFGAFRTAGGFRRVMVE